MAKAEPYPECFLGSVVNPGEYWLVSKLKTHAKDVKILEEMLSDEMSRILTTPDPQFLVPQCCVAVENASSNGKWQRGKIIKKLERNVYLVFLVDCGHFTDVGLRHLQLIEDRKYLNVEPLAFKLQLYGVVPFIVTDNCKKKVSEIWSTEANEFVSNIFSQRLLIYVKKVCVINRIVFGDLYLIDKPNVPSYSLRKLLCRKEYGIYAESYYKRKVMDIHSPASTSSVREHNYLSLPSEITMKLERVKEWQLSTVQHEKTRREDESGILDSPSGGISDLENMNFNLDRKKCETSAGVGLTEKESRKQGFEESSGAKTSHVNCIAHVSPTVTSPETKSSSGSVGNAGGDISSRRPSLENKKEYNLVLEEGSKEFPSAEDDCSVGIFTWFSDSIVQPVNKLRDLNVSRNIVVNLEKEGNFSNLSPIQRWAIPSIQRGHNVVVIGSAKTGKTLSYLIPLLTILQDRLPAKEVRVGNGPVAIILCSGSRSCDIIDYICHLLLRSNSEKEKNGASVRVAAIYGTSREKKSWVHLTNGCELLISTPHCLARLLKYRGITNLERLSYLVLDEIDIIIEEPFLSPVKIILHQSKLSKDCQRVFCGEKWTPELENLVRTFAKSRAILIGSYLEATIYAKLKPQVLLVDKDKKSQIVLDAALPQIGKSKILIACEHASEVLHLDYVFKTRGYSPLVAHSDMVVHDIKAIENRWKSATNAPVLICCDDVIHRLAVDDAEMLVHYSLPAESKTNFGKRFSVLLEKCGKHSQKEGFPKGLGIVVLIDDQNHYQLPHIVNFVLRLGGKIPRKVEELSREISWRIEANKKDVPICRDLLEFGECRNVKNCVRRHAFINAIDSPQVPLSGLVKFQVLQVHSVCHLSVRPLEVIDKRGKKTAYENLTGEIADKLRAFYEFEENRTFVGEVEVNKLCAVEVEDAHGKRFERGRIVEFKKINKLNKVTEVVVKFLDSGQILRVSVYKLYELLEDLKNYAPQALDIFICNLLPNDFDRTWNEEAVYSAKSLFTAHLKDNQFWIGRIRLSLKNSLHLESVTLCRFIENLKTYVIDLSARRKLLTQGIAVENEKHLEKLYLLCEKGNIEFHRYEVSDEKEMLNVEMDAVEPQWAFLDGDLPRVEFVSAMSTDCFFLRITKFKNLLMKLDKDCQEIGNEMKMCEKAKKRSDNKWSPQVGMYCLGLYENSWNRGKILSVINDEVSVFFIDRGSCHCVEDVLPIPDALLKQLPAQAIECCLVGVKHVSAVSDRTVGEIYSFSDGGEGALYISVIGKDQDSQMTGGWKYQVNLVNADGLSLSRKLVASDLVEAEQDTFHLAKNMEIAISYSESGGDMAEISTNEGDEEENYVEELCRGEDILKLASAEEPTSIINFSEDVFDDENAQLMVEEFMAHVFPWSTTGGEAVHEEKVEVLDGKPPTSSAKKSEASAIGNQNDIPNTKCIYEEKSEAKSHTPQLVWCQDHIQVQIKIVLNAVERYRLTCSVTHFLFRCILDGKLYVAGLRLFGSVNPHQTEVRVKPFHVQVILKKVCPLHWPRLPRDKHKYRWIKYDVEDYDADQCSYVEEILKKALARIESGQIKQSRIRREEIKLVSSTDPDDSSGSDSSADDDDNFI